MPDQEGRGQGWRQLIETWSCSRLIQWCYSSVGGGYYVETDTTHSRSPHWERGEEASPSVCVCVRRHHRSSPGRWRLMTCYSCYTVLPIPTPSSPSRPELRQPSQWRRFLHVHRDSEFSEFGFRHHTVRKKYGPPNAPLPVKYATGYTV